MAKFITVPSAFTIYKVKDKYAGLTKGELPPIVVLEIMVQAGRAERVGTIGHIMQNHQIEVTQDEADEEGPPEGLWGGDE